MDHNETEPTIVSLHTTKSVFYCPHVPQLEWDVHDTISPWILAAFASIISPAAVLLNALIIIAIKKKGENSETLQHPVVKYGHYGPSSRWYMCAVICYRWTITFLSNSFSSAYLHPIRGNCLFYSDLDILFGCPSDINCMGEVRGHSKMEELQRYCD